MILLNWMGEHPILTFFLAYMLMCAVISIAVSIGNGLAGRRTAFLCGKSAGNKEPK